MSSFLRAGLTVSNLVSNGSRVKFDQVDDSSGGDATIDVLVNKGRFTLAPALWMIAAVISTSRSGSANRRFHLYDFTNAEEVGGTEIMTANSTSYLSTGGGSLLARIINVTVSTEFEIQLSQTASVTVVSERSHLSMQKLN